MASPFSTRTVRAWPHLPGLVPDTAINPCTSEEANEDKDRQVEKSKDSEPGIVQDRILAGVGCLPYSPPSVLVFADFLTTRGTVKRREAVIRLVCPSGLLPPMAAAASDPRCLWLSAKSIPLLPLLGFGDYITAVKWPDLAEPLWLPAWVRLLFYSSKRALVTLGVYLGYLWTIPFKPNLGRQYHQMNSSARSGVGISCVLRNFLAVQKLGIWASTSRGTGLILRSCGWKKKKMCSPFYPQLGSPHSFCSKSVLL